MSDASEYMMSDEIPGEAPASDAPPLSSPSPTPEQGVPANLDAERTVLGAIFLDNAAHSEAAEKLESHDFFLDSHQRIFLRMQEIIDAGGAIDIVTLANCLDTHKEIQIIGGVSYLASLTEGLPLRPVIDAYIRIVKDKSLMRQLMAICAATIARAADQTEPAIDVLEDVESRLLEVAQDAVTGKLRTVAESVELAGGVDPYMAPILNPVAMTGLMTGFTDLDAMTGGLQKKELTVIAARPSQGKTGFLLNVLQNIALETAAVAAFFSLEMSQESIERRLLASIATVDVRRAMSGEFLSGDERDKLHEALGRLVESKIYIDDTPALTTTQMRAKARRLRQREGRLDIVGLDYLQLMSANRRYQNRQEEVASISRSLKQMAKELNCPVIALAQLNRSNEQRSDKRPVLSDLRESGQLEQDADVVAFIHRDEYYDRDNEDVRGLADIIIAKQRNGPTGLVKLAFVSKLVRFQNLAKGW